METIDLGNVAIVSKGIHDKTLSYEKLNEVQEESTQNWYRAKKNVPEQIELDNEEYWELVRDNTNVGGDKNVQSDWNQEDTEADDYIKNKPDVGDENVQSDWNQTDDTADDYIKNKPDVGDENVQSDWNQTDDTADDYIKNKPNVGDENVQSDWNQTDDAADDYIKNKPNIESKFDFVSVENPTTNLNPTKVNATALNKTTGEIFTCTNNTANENIWIGQLGTVVRPFHAGVLDPFNDNSGKFLYEFEGNADDLGAVHNATWSGTEAYANAVRGQGAKLNGSDSYIDIGNITPTKNYTTTLWLKMNDTSKDQTVWWIEKNTSTALEFYAADGNVGFIVRDSNATNHKVKADISGEAEFVFLACTVTDNLTVKIHLNGVFVASTTTPNVRNYGSYCEIGRNHSYSDTYANCVVDDYRTFTRALTDEEIQSLYDNGRY